MLECLSFKVKKTFQKLFNSYKNFHGDVEFESTQASHDIGTSDVEVIDNSFAMEFEKDMNMSQSMNKNEVDLHLMETSEKATPSFDMLNWWKVNSTKYPTLAEIAKDVLAMPLSTVASQSAFSIGVEFLILTGVS